MKNDEIEPKIKYSKVTENTSREVPQLEQDIDSLVLDNFYAQHDQQREKVKSFNINWDAFADTYLNQQTLKLVKVYDKGDDESRLTQLQKGGQEYTSLFVSLLHNVKEESYIQYLLTFVDEIIFEKTHPNRIQNFLDLRKSNSEYPFKTFMRFLEQPDPYISYLGSKILATLMVHSKELDEKDVYITFKWVSSQLQDININKKKIAVLALKIFLKTQALRQYFVQHDGFIQLAPLLSDQLHAVVYSKENKDKHPDRDLQFIYDILYCFWLLSFDEETGNKCFTEQSGVVKNVVRLVAECEVEKIRRIGFACLRNLKGRGTSASQMIYAKLHHTLRIFQNKVFGDKDITDDINVLNEVCEKQLIEMTSWDKYKQEILSSDLEWSPSHTSEKFWRENVNRFGEDDFVIVGVLVELLNSKKPQVQAIACHDLGEFSRYHPRGKRFIQEKNIHARIMILLNESHDEEVQKHTLLCLQKIMVANWEYLSKN